MIARNETGEMYERTDIYAKKLRFLAPSLPEDVLIKEHADAQELCEIQFEQVMTSFGINVPSDNVPKRLAFFRHGWSVAAGRGGLNSLVPQLPRFGFSLFPGC